MQKKILWGVGLIIMLSAAPITVLANVVDENGCIWGISDNPIVVGDNSHGAGAGSSQGSSQSNTEISGSTENPSATIEQENSGSNSGTEISDNRKPGSVSEEYIPGDTSVEQVVTPGYETSSSTDGKSGYTPGTDGSIVTESGSSSEKTGNTNNGSDLDNDLDKDNGKDPYNNMDKDKGKDPSNNMDKGKSPDSNGQTGDGVDSSDGSASGTVPDKGNGKDGDGKGDNGKGDNGKGDKGDASSSESEKGKDSEDSNESDISGDYSHIYMNDDKDGEYWSEEGEVNWESVPGTIKNVTVTKDGTMIIHVVDPSGDIVKLDWNEYWDNMIIQTIVDQDGNLITKVSTVNLSEEVHEEWTYLHTAWSIMNATNSESKYYGGFRQVAKTKESSAKLWPDVDGQYRVIGTPWFHVQYYKLVERESCTTTDGIEDCSTWTEKVIVGEDTLSKSPTEYTVDVPLICQGCPVPVMCVNGACDPSTELNAVSDDANKPIFDIEHWSELEK